MRLTILLASILIASLYPISVQATIVDLTCRDRPSNLLPADRWSFDYETQWLTLNEVVSDVASEPYLPRWEHVVKVWGTIDGDSVLTVAIDITNDSGVPWTAYRQIVSFPLGNELSHVVLGTAHSTKFTEVNDQPPDFAGILFSGPDPVLDGESFTVQFDVLNRGQLSFNLYSVAVPEPGTFALLACAVLYLRRRRPL